MTIFENPFYLLDADMCDNRRKLQTLYAEKSLLGDEALLENALQTLTSPAKRLPAELRWLPGCDNAREIVDRLNLYTKNESCFYKDVISIIYDEIDIPVINLLLTLLPKIDNDDLCETICGISALQLNIYPKFLLDAINRTRSKANFPSINDVTMIENELRVYNLEISTTVLTKVRKLTLREYHDLVVNFASDSSHQLLDDILHDYALAITPHLQHIIDNIKSNTAVLRRSSIKFEHQNELDELKQLCSEWQYYMVPLQDHAIVTGSQSIVKEKEDDIVPFLIDSAKELLNQNAPQEALCFWELLYGITPDGGTYKDLREAISNILTSFISLREERDAAIADRYRKAALDAWEAEKAQYDKEARLRSEEAAEKEKERIQQNKIERYKQLSQQAWEEEQRKNDEEARQRSRMAEKQAKEQRERARQKEEMQKARLALLTQKESLQARRKVLGIFSGKEKKKIDDEIAGIERKLAQI